MMLSCGLRLLRYRNSTPGGAPGAILDLPFPPEWPAGMPWDTMPTLIANASNVDANRSSACPQEIGSPNLPRTSRSRFQCSCLGIIPDNPAAHLNRYELNHLLFHLEEAGVPE